MEFTITGQPPSKSNTYQVIKINGHCSLCKSKSLKEYEDSFFLQIPASFRGLNLAELLHVELACYFRSMRSDLDNAAKVILDCLQRAKVIKNDNRVVELEMSKHIDKENPRVEIKLYEQ